MSGAIAAVGAEARANQGIADAVRGAAELGGQYAENEKQEQIYADKLGFEVQVKDAESRARMAIEAIPVGGGVIYKDEAEAIFQREYGTLRDYLGSPGNVRHKGSTPEFEMRLKSAEADARRNIAEFGAHYQRQLSTKLGERTVELGIQSGNEKMIEKGIFAQHQAGKYTRDEADSVYEKSVQKMHGVQDVHRMDQFNLLKADGDWDTAKEVLEQMQGPEWTRERKDLFFRTERANGAYSETALEIQEAQGLGDLSDIESSMGDRRYLDAKHKPVLQRNINAARNRIERTQAANADGFVRAAAKGEIDWVAFGKAREDDTASGIPTDMGDAIEKLAQHKESQFEQGRQFDQDKDNILYVGLLNRLTSERYGTRTTGQGRNKVTRVDRSVIEGKRIDLDRQAEYSAYLEEIEAIPVGSQARAELYEAFLMMKAADTGEGVEKLNKKWFGRGKREMSTEERNLRVELIEQYREQLQSGLPEEFATSLDRDEALIRDEFLKPKPDIDSLREAVIVPRRQAVMRNQMRGEGQRAQPEGAPVAISTKEEYDALPAGARFIFQGKAGQK